MIYAHLHLAKSAKTCLGGGGGYFSQGSPQNQGSGNQNASNSCYINYLFIVLTYIIITEKTQGQEHYLTVFCTQLLFKILDISYLLSLKASKVMYARFISQMV